MSCDNFPMHNICIRKGSNYVFAPIFYSNAALTSLYDLSAFDTATMTVLDKQKGSALFSAISGSINQGASKVTFTIPPATTSALAANTGYYEIKLSNSGDATLDQFFFRGIITFED